MHVILSEAKDPCPVKAKMGSFTTLRFVQDDTNDREL